MMLKKILEKAYKKENMQWRVYAFNPEKDNELVYTSKAFDCIADAQVDKVEQLKKYPNYVVEISTTRVGESIKKNSEKLKVGDIAKWNNVLWVKINSINGNKANVSPIHKEDIDSGKFKKKEIVLLNSLRKAESAQKNEGTLKNGTKVKVIKGGYSGKTGTIAGTAEEYDPDTRRTTNYCYMVKIPGQGIIQIDRDKVVAESSQKNEAMPPKGQRKRIDFEDDIVRVYDGNKEIYAGAEDYEPMKDENWKWDEANKYYKFDKYIKVCSESSQKNEAKQQGRDIDFDNVGGGFTVALTWQNRFYGFECSGYSNNTSGKKLVFANDKIAYTEQGYDELEKLQPKITKDLRDAADKFDKEIAAVFAKYGFKKK